SKTVGSVFVGWVRGILSRLRQRGEARSTGGSARDRNDVPRKSRKKVETPGVRDLHDELFPKAGADEPEATPTREFEVVLPERRPAEALTGVRELAPGEYTPPPFSILDLGHGDPEHDAEGTSHRLTQALAELGVEAHVVRAVVGPRVTRYEMRLGSGVKVGKVRNLQQDIAYALAATEVRILAPIPGKSAVGVEVPNTRPAKVTLGDVFQSYPDANDWTLPVGLGKDISGRAVFFDLSEMPHLLVAGTTGSGKSVMLNGLLTSLLLTTDPRQVKMVLIDPKRVELSLFGRVPHLITPVVTDVKKAANALGWAVAEMERRYEVLEKMGVRSLEGYNDRAETQMPYVVVVIDELADLMMQAGAKVEDAIIRLAQKARAVGIHLVVATQRPSVDVITGMIKANVPSRIAFAVSSQVDSRVILDSPGAEALLGMGDMLYKPVSAARPSRVQGAFISEAEVERVVSATADAASGRVEAEFVEEVTKPRSVKEENDEPEDDLLPEAATFVVSTQQASVSAVQRRFRVGYSRAGRIIDALERKGVVGPYEGSKSRAVVASPMDVESLFGDGRDSDPYPNRKADSAEDW
ncbi:MAG: DNA translocase FtsK, partial [Rubrobacter sp.]